MWCRTSMWLRQTAAARSSCPRAGKARHLPGNYGPSCPSWRLWIWASLPVMRSGRVRAAASAASPCAAWSASSRNWHKGHLQTHTAGNRVDVHFLAEVAARAQAPFEVQEEIRRANTARHFAEIALVYGIQGVFPLLCELVCQHSFTHVKGALSVEAVLLGFDGRVLGQAKYGPAQGELCHG